MKISEKLIKLRKEHGLNQTEFANKIGVTQKTVSFWEQDKNIPDVENITMICNIFNLPVNYFDIQLKTDNLIDSEETLPIDYYPDVFGSCGSGAFVPSERKEVLQVPKKLFTSFSPVKKYSVINAVGESMLPNIHDKDRLIVEHWEGGQIKDNRVYVFCYMNEIFVKRLVKNIDEIIIQSDNPDPMYRARHIEKEDMNNVLIVGEIIGLMRDMR